MDTMKQIVAKRIQRRDHYADDVRHGPSPLGPRPQRWPETGQLRRRTGSMALTNPAFAGGCLHLAGLRPINPRLQV